MRVSVFSLFLVTSASAFSSLPPSFSSSTTAKSHAGSALFYERDDSSDASSPKKKKPTEGNNNNKKNNNNMFTVLSNTEKWLNEIVAKHSPYVQKKSCQYVCEISHEDVMVVASLWRRLREARQLGEAHGLTQEGMMQLTTVDEDGGEFLLLYCIVCYRIYRHDSFRSHSPCLVWGHPFVFFLSPHATTTNSGIAVRTRHNIPSDTGRYHPQRGGDRGQLPAL